MKVTSGTRVKVTARATRIALSSATLAVLGGSLPALAQPLSSTLAVNDNRSVGALGDNLLSLGEAVRVAGGVTKLTELSRAERGQVKGDPAKAQTKVIKVALRPRTTISADAPMPPLRGLAGTVIDGGGATLLGTSTESGTGFTVDSSRLTIRDFTMRGFGTGVSVVPSSTAELAWITLDRLEITSNTFDVNITGSGGSGPVGAVRHVRISRSRFHGVPGGQMLAGINVTGQNNNTPGLIDDISIVGNWFGDHMLERIQLVGIQALGGTPAPAATPSVQLSRVRVANNVFTTCPDPCVLAYAASVIGGEASGAAIDGLVIENNSMRVNGLGITVIGGYTLAAGSTSGSTVRHLTIRNNVIRPANSSAAGVCTGIGVIGDWTDYHAGHAVGSVVEDVTVTGNDVLGCARGLIAAGTFAGEPVSGVVRDSIVRRVVVKANRFTSNTVGVELSGMNFDYGRVWGNNPTALGAAGAVIIGNVVADALVEGNRFDANRTAVLVTGASINLSHGNVVLDNVARNVRVGRNTYINNQRNCRAVDELTNGVAGVRSGNSVAPKPC